LPPEWHFAHRTWPTLQKAAYFIIVTLSSETDPNRCSVYCSGNIPSLSITAESASANPHEFYADLLLAATYP